MLEVRNLSKRFGGLKAVTDASLDVPEGSIVGLLGPNGAGKTTCFTMIAGFTKADEGTVRFQGKDITGLAPHSICALGMIRTFQIVQPFAGLTVQENIAVGAYLHHHDRREAMSVAREVGKRLGMGAMLDRPASSLTIAGRKRLELARALATGAKLLLLDEPSAGMTHDETRELMDDILLVRGRDRNLTIIIVEHEMGVIERITDRCVVLNFGRKIAEGPYRAVAADPQVQEAYLGVAL